MIIYSVRGGGGGGGKGGARDCLQHVLGLQGKTLYGAYVYIYLYSSTYAYI